MEDTVRQGNSTKLQNEKESRKVTQGRGMSCRAKFLDKIGLMESIHGKCVEINTLLNLKIAKKFKF